MGQICQNKFASRSVEPRNEKTCLMPYANNKGADLRSLISAFVVHCRDSIIPTVLKSRISRL